MTSRYNNVTQGTKKKSNNLDRVLDGLDPNDYNSTPVTVHASKPSRASAASASRYGNVPQGADKSVSKNFSPVMDSLDPKDYPKTNSYTQESSAGAALRRAAPSMTDKQLNDRDASVRRNNDIRTNWDNWLQLAQKDTLSTSERAEAKRAAALLSEQATSLRGQKTTNNPFKYIASAFTKSDDVAVSAGDRQKANSYDEIAKMLNAKTSGRAAIAAGAAQAVAPWADKAMKADVDVINKNSYAKASGLDDEEQTAIKNFYFNEYGNIAANNPKSALVGGIAGSVASAAVGIGAADAALKGAEWYARLSKPLQAAISSGSFFSAQSGVSTASQIPSEEEWNAYQENQSQIAEEMGGAPYTPKPYDRAALWGNVAQQASIGAATGAVFGAVASGLGELGKSVLARHGLQTPFMEAVRNVTAATGGAAASEGVNYALQSDGQKPTQEQIVQNVATVFLLSALTSGVGAIQTTRANKAAIGYAVQEMQGEYARTFSSATTREEKAAALDHVTEYNDLVRKAVSQHYYAGNQAYIDDVLKTLDAIDEQIGRIRESGMADTSIKLTENMASGYTSGQSANVAAAPAAAPKVPFAMPQRESVAYIQNGILREQARNQIAALAARTVGESGQKAMMQNYDGGDVGTYGAGFLKAYHAGETGKSFDSVTVPLDPAQKFAAFVAGVNDAKRETVTKSATAQTANVKPSAEKPVLQIPKSESTIKPESEPSGTPSAQLAGKIGDMISKGKEFNSAWLFEQADRAFGGTQAEGIYTPKDAYDAMELAVNKHLLTATKDLNGDAKSAAAGVSALQTVLDRLPTQTKRTDEQVSFQQFSTPPTIAYLAAWSAGITPKDTVLEPSAGTGGIAVFAKAWGATVDVNELSERRLVVLKEMGFDRVFNENAEQLNNVLPDDMKPSVVLMNPPFSSTAGRTATNKTSNAERHIEQALLRLDDGGRLVAILGKGMADDAPAFRDWWNKIRKTYTVRANIGIDGANYKKYGTSWGVQLVVIDKTGPQTGETLTGSYKDLTEIPGVMEGIRNDRGRVETGALDVRAGGAVSGTVVGHLDGAGAGGRALGRAERVGGSVAGHQSESALQPDHGRGAVQSAGDRSTVQSAGGGGHVEPVAGSVGAVPSDVHSEPERIGGEPDRPESQPARPRQVKSKAKSDNGVYAEYIAPKLPITGAKKHPAKLVESAAMGAVGMPEATYKPKLPKELVESGALSDAQITNIVYAGQAHEQKLPDGSRKGYFIGDGTGVGKGRQIAGIILDNFNHGRDKAVWVSKSSNLYPDAQRDWSDIGGDKEKVFSLAKTKLGDKISVNDGILFASYDTIASEKGTQNRLQQIADWLGKDFDGVVAFDEAHNMGNLLGKQGSRGKTKPAAKALAGAKLQELLPNARVVYVSATAATDVNELAFAQRLGLWGRGTEFHDVNDFVSKISSRGLAAMELVARDMKSLGVYQARSISYDDVSYDTLKHDLTPMQAQIYNTMCKAWQVTLQNIGSALEVTGGKLNAQARSGALSAYYGAMQRFYNQILTSMSMPTVIADMKTELSAGHSCVLQIVNTNQAESDRQIAKAKEIGAALEDLDLTPKGTLIEYLKNSFPVNAYEEYTDDKGNKLSRPVMDKDGNPVIDREAVRMRDELIAQVNEMSVPEGPLEMLFDAFGTEQVAEVTGRSRRVVPHTDEKGQTKLVEERRTPAHTEADVQAFQDGKKHILIFSDAGGTGKSYHADKRAKNQELRVHYLVQPGWSATKAVQGFGRTHRSNEASAPIYKLVTTDIKGQKRFVSTIARRLDQLGALTKGQRQTGSGMFSDKDNLESDLSRDSLRNFYDNLGHDRIEGISGQDVLTKLGLWQKFTDEYGSFKLDENVARDMNTFLNRILVLDVDEQNAVFDEFNRIFETNYDTALKNGTLDRGLENVKADKIEIIDNTPVRTDENTGATTNYLQAKTFRKPELLTTIERLAEWRGSKTDFRGIFKTDKGEVRAVYRIADKTDQRGNVTKQFRLQSPVASKYSTWNEKSLAEHAKELPKAEWGKAWDGEVAKAPEYEENTVHMLTGTLLPIWNKLPQEHARVMRIVADDGSQYLGRVIPANRIDDVLKLLGAGGRTKETADPAQLMDAILKDGKTASLEIDRTRLERHRVSGENRIEIKGTNLWYLTQQYKGIISETINYERRYFIPTGEAGKTLLAEIIKDNPVQSVADTQDDTDSLKKIGAGSIGSGNYKLNLYSERQIENWAGSKSIVIYKDQNQLTRFLNNAIDGYGLDKKMYFGTIPEDLAARVKQETGVDIEGYNCVLRASEVRKILKDHGDEDKEALRGQRAVTVRDIRAIPEIVSEPDTITLSNELYQGKPAIHFVKTINGKTTVVSYISQKHLDLTVQTMYAGINKGSLATTPSGSKPFSQTPETLSGTASTDTIPQVEEKINSEAATDLWTASRNKDSAAEKTMPISDILNKARHDFGIPITTGHIHGTDLGQYHRNAETIRTKIANDLPTVAHELGHHLDRRYGLTKYADQSMIDELTGGLPDGFKDAYPENKWKTEGLAEFMRQYLQSLDETAKAYPKFTLHFLSVLSPEDAKSITDLADQINAYYALDSETAQSAIRFREEQGMDFRTKKEKAEDKKDRLYQAWVDSNHGIKRFDRAAGTNAYMLATNAAYADNIAAAVLEGDLTDMNGQRVGDGLRTVLKDINLKDDNEYRAFGEYLTVKHAPERMKEGMRIFADERKNNPHWCAARQNILERQYPEFKKTSERLYDFQAKFLQTWGVDTGLVSADSAKSWAERWQFYVPFNRAVGDKGLAGARRGFADQNSTIRQAHGSGLDLVHPVDNIMNNMVRMINAGIRNNVMATITREASRNEGLGYFLEQVPEPLRKETVNISGLKSRLNQSIENSGLSQGDKDETQSIIEDLDDVLVQYKTGHKSGDVITVLVDGAPQYWKINDPMLLSSITNMSAARLPAFLETYGQVNRFMVSNITGNNILWSIFSNFPRDFMTAMTFSEDKNPLKMLSGIGSAYVNLSKGPNADPLFKEYKAMGGGHVSVYTADRDFTAQVRKKIRGDDRLKWLNPIETLDFVADAIETGPRYSYYRTLRNKGYAPMEAYYAAMDLTTNFRRSGMEGRQTNKLIPFFNAGVQGIDRFVRWATGEENIPHGQTKEERAKTTRGRMTAFILSSVGIAAMLYAVNSKTDDDKKNYAQLSNYTKNSYFCVPIGDGKYFCIPKPREIAVLESAFECVMDRFGNGNEHAFDEFWSYSNEQMLPNVLSDLAHGDFAGAIGSLGVLGVGAYLMANRDFLGRPIVSDSMQSLEPKDQYTARTSKLAYWIGQAFGISPLKVDYFCNNILGGWWKAQKALFPVGGEAEQDKTLGIQGQYIKDSQYSTDVVNRLYDTNTEASREAKSNPDDISAKIAAKWTSLMTGFYSAYNKVSKNADDSTEQRSTRQTVLNMIMEFQKAYDSGSKTGAQKVIEGVCTAKKTTDYMPQVMENSVTGGDGVSHTLTASQYVDYQTDYLARYYAYAESVVNTSDDIDKQAQALEIARKYAKDTAAAKVLKIYGSSTKASEKIEAMNDAGIDGTHQVLFQAALKMYDADGNGHIKQEEAENAINSLDGLSNGQKSALWHSVNKGWKDKSNPYA